MKKNHISSNIKFLREFKGLTQCAFAELFDVSRDNIASYERGSEPRVSFLVSVVNYFHITFEDLINVKFDETFFETKCAENVTLSKGDKKGDKKGDIPNVQKMSPFNDASAAPTIIYRDDPLKDEIIALQKKNIALLEQQVSTMAEQIADLKKELPECGFVYAETYTPAASGVPTVQGRDDITIRIPPEPTVGVKRP